MKLKREAGMNILFTGIIFTFFITLLSAQEFTGTPVSTWAEAGMQDSIPEYDNVLNAIDYGADSTGQVSSSEAVKAILETIDSPSIIYFPEGKYLFDQAIILKNYTVIRGEGVGKTVFEFDFNHENKNLIQISGSIFNQYSLHLNGLERGSLEADLIQIADVTGWKDVYLSFIDTALMTSSWSYGSGGGLYELTDVSADKVLVASSFRIDVKSELQPIFTRVEGIRGVGLECFSIVRRDSTAYQASNLAEESW